MRNTNIKEFINFIQSDSSLSPDKVKNALDWITENADPEWIQLFLHAKLDTARADNTFGVLAAHLGKNPKIKKFLDSYRKLLGNT